MTRRKTLTIQLLILLAILLPVQPLLVTALTMPDPEVHLPLEYRPASTSTPGSPPYVPSDIWKAYNYLPLYAQGINGTGTGIAIVDAYGSTSITTDLATFNSITGLPPATLNIYYPDGNPGRCSGPTAQTCKNWGTETSLDVEWAHAIAPAATIDLVVALDPSETHIYDAIAYVANTLTSETVLSMSFGLSESQYPTTGTGTIPNTHQLFVTMTSHGTTPFASSGDTAPSTCCNIEYPASDPLVVSVGGTSLTLNSTSGYVSETTWSGTTAGSSIVYSKPAYQQGLGDNMRDDVDVSYNGDPNTGFYVVKGNFAYQVGGTSAGAPQWAALIALASQASGTRFSSILSMLYASTSYHDVTTGSDTFFSASTGWDYPTGLGTPDATGIANSLVGTADVALTSLVPSRNFAYSGVISNPIIVNVTAANLGTLTETFTVTLKANGTTAGSQTITLQTQNVTVQFSWNPSLLPRGAYILTAQATTVPREKNTANNFITENNTFTNRLRGDTNADCQINIIDLSSVGAVFGSTPPNNINDDINNDGTVNIIDLSAVGSVFGQSC